MKKIQRRRVARVLRAAFGVPWAVSHKLAAQVISDRLDLIGSRAVQVENRDALARFGIVLAQLEWSQCPCGACDALPYPSLWTGPRGPVQAEVLEMALRWAINPNPPPPRVAVGGWSPGPMRN